MFIPGGSSERAFSVNKKLRKPDETRQMIQDDSEDTAKSDAVVNEVEKQG